MSLFIPSGVLALHLRNLFFAFSLSALGVRTNSEAGELWALTLHGSLSPPVLSLHLSCLTTDTEWYSGETCEFSTKKSLVYGLLGAVGAVMLVVLVILLVFTFRSKREVKRQKSKVAQLSKWHEEDGGTAPGTFQNIGFDISEEKEDSIHLDSIYSNFPPSLGQIDSKKKIKIQRPQVVMTSI